ncbi:MAG: cobalamin biosynthesis protein [Rickettsiales bacterium]|nr:cobalamin biosynthesis protein [Rickettsiales bacterium]
MELVLLHPLEDRVMVSVAVLLLSIILTHHVIWSGLNLDRYAKPMQRFIIRMDRKLNRSKRSMGTRIYRGMIMLSFAVLLALGCSLLVHVMVSRVPPLQVLELAMVIYLLPARHFWDVSRELNKPLEDQDVPHLKSLLQPLLRRSFPSFDAHTAARTGIEWLMHSFSKHIVAGVFWYIIGGLPALLIMRTIALADRIVGYRSEHYFAFGWSSAKLDDLLQWIPARLASICLILASFFVPKCKPWAALRGAVNDSRRIRSSNRGMAIATTAGALGVALGGPRHLDSGTIEDGWVGSGSAKATTHDLVRAQFLYVVACLFLMLVLSFAVAILTQMGWLESWHDIAHHLVQTIQSFIGK